MPRGPQSLTAVAGCFLLSGFAALLYQSAWLRTFAVVFGTSELAVATVLAAYMGGLALGAMLAGRLVRRVRRPILAYAVLEAAIAVSALLVPWLMGLAGTLFGVLVGGRPGPPDASGIGQTAYFLIAAFLVVAIPTACMGATLPMLIRYAVANRDELGRRTGLLYAVNTAGAVAGAVAAGFVLLPAVGLNGTMLTAVGMNVLVFLLAIGVLRDRPEGRLPDRSQESEPQSASSFIRACIAPLFGAPVGRADGAKAGAGAREWILPLMLVSGANAFLLEVLLTRLLSHVLGGTIYAFATMLATFLAGIAIGGAAGGFVASTEATARRYFPVVQFSIAATIALVYSSLQWLVPDSVRFAPLVAFSAAAMLPATIFIGATYPLAVRILARDALDGSGAAARVYAWNTAGAIGGALAAGFVLIPGLGFDSTVRVAVATAVSLAVAAAWLFGTGAARTRFAVTAAAIVTVFVFRPSEPAALVERSVLDGRRLSGDEVFYRVGRSSTVRVVAVDGKFAIQTNGLPEATVLPAGAPLLGQPHQWLTALALAARPDAGSMLFVGLGGGVALERLPASVEAVDVIELEAAVVDANRAISALRAADPLGDSRLRIIVNDARGALKLTSKRYDLIVSQPSHPWTAGASHLYTMEFLREAKTHLHTGGALLQWMSASFVDAQLVRDLAATLQAVFVNVRLYQAGTALYFLASDDSLAIEHELRDSGGALRANALYYGSLGLNGVDDFIAALSLDEAGVRTFSGRGIPITDDRNRMATASLSRADGIGAGGLSDLWAEHDPLQDPASWIYSDFSDALDFPYIATRLMADGRGARVRGMITAVPEAGDREVIRSIGQSVDGDNAAARETLQSALSLDPAQSAARFALVRPYLSLLAAGRADPDVEALARSLPRSARAVVDGWRAALTGDYDELAMLDRALAGAAPNELWFADAMRLRADWRVQSRDEMALRDSIRLIDRALVLRRDIDLLMLRLAAADALGDPNVFVETAREAVGDLQSEIDTFTTPRPADASERRLLHRRIEALRRGLSRHQSGFNGRGLALLRAEVDELYARSELLQLELGR